MYYDQFDDEQLGYLTYKQARNFFEQVLELNFKRKAHRKTFVQIIKIVDPEHYKIVTKERIFEFFEISGFKIIAILDAEQKRLQKVLKAQKDIENNAKMSNMAGGELSYEDSDSSYDDEDSDSSDSESLVQVAGQPKAAKR